MFTVDTSELQAIRAALHEDPRGFGVGLLHLPSGRVALRPFDRLRQRGGHGELMDDLGWPPDECRGFLLARPAGEYKMINLAQVNAQTGPLYMPPDVFRAIVLSLRKCWVDMGSNSFPG